MSLKAAVVLATAVALSACTPSSGLQRTGSDTFWITTPMAKASGAAATAKDQATHEANDECAKQGKDATLVNDTSTPESVRLMFQCVS
jgi:hypothetical protein